MAALLLLLFTQAGVLHASAAPTCPGSDDLVPEQSTVTGASVVPKDSATPVGSYAGNGHLPPTETPAVNFGATACGAVALAVAAPAADSPPVEAASFPPVDEALPRLPTHAFFRPPRLS
jgi:hypothetical protein